MVFSYNQYCDWKLYCSRALSSSSLSMVDNSVLMLMCHRLDLLHASSIRSQGLTTYTAYISISASNPNQVPGAK